MKRIPWIPSLPGPGTFPRIPNISYTTLVFCAILLIAATIVPVEGAGGEGGGVLILVDPFGGCKAKIFRVGDELVVRSRWSQRPLFLWQGFGRS